MHFNKHTQKKHEHSGDQSVISQEPYASHVCSSLPEAELDMSQIKNEPLDQRRLNVEPPPRRWPNIKPALLVHRMSEINTM